MPQQSDLVAAGSLASRTQVGGALGKRGAQLVLEVVEDVVPKEEIKNLTVVETNLFDAVACFNTLFSDVSRVKYNIGLTLFGYLTSA
jgi:hypothetical protein